MSYGIEADPKYRRRHSRGLLSLPVLGAVGWLAVQGRIGKVPKQRTTWSYRSPTEKAKDEISRGFGEQQVWGWEENGVWHRGRWERLLSQGEEEHVMQKWRSTFRMDREAFLQLYER